MERQGMSPIEVKYTNFLKSMKSNSKMNQHQFDSFY